MASRVRLHSANSSRNARAGRAKPNSPALSEGDPSFGEIRPLNKHPPCVLRDEPTKKKKRSPNSEKPRPGGQPTQGRHDTSTRAHKPRTQAAHTHGANTTRKRPHTRRNTRNASQERRTARTRERPEKHGKEMIRLAESRRGSRGWSIQTDTGFGGESIQTRLSGVPIQESRPSLCQSRSSMRW